MEKKEFPMAKKPFISNSSAGKSFTSKPEPASTVSRGSPVPRPSPVKREITHEMIAKRAFEIHMSGKGASPTENWLRAERELKAQFQQ
jgi:hypothetical protein